VVTSSEGAPADRSVAVVTGAARGLGLAIARELVGANVDVAIFDVDQRAGEEAARELVRSAPARARFYAVDVTDSTAVDEGMANVVSDFGRLDILVNNAGVGHVGPHTEDTTDEEWSLAIGVMQNGVFYCMRSAASHLLKRGSGRVVNISSIRGLSPKPGRIAYCAAKAAVIMMTKVAAAEWGASGVTVNAIAPGFLRTEMW
jgi:NAD(P)-dependent dehydrogenase (short-subunit alcohol dehydrogenase family)